MTPAEGDVLELTAIAIFETVDDGSARFLGFKDGSSVGWNDLSPGMREVYRAAARAARDALVPRAVAPMTLIHALAACIVFWAMIVIVVVIIV